MIDTATLNVLCKHVRRTARSLLEYAGESYPWVRDAAGVSILAALQKMIQEEQEATTAIFKFLGRRHVTPPHFDPYPMHFTNFNFLAMGRMLALITESHGRDVAELEADLKLVRDPEAKKLLQHLLEVKKLHLESLTTLA